MATTWRYGGYCACGCGERTKLAYRNHKAMRWKKDEPLEFIRGHQNNNKRKGYDEQDCGYDTPCHIWRGQPSQQYPSLKVRGKPVKVHQYFWEQLNGAVPEGLVLHHRCETPRCCNPEHLAVETVAGNAHYRADTRLSMDKADQIRRFAAIGYSARKLAEIYDVSRGSIEQVLNGKTWRPVELVAPQGPPRRKDN